MKLSAAMAFSTVSASGAEGSIMGVRMPGKDRLPRERDDEQPRGQYLVGRDDVVVAHFLSPLIVSVQVKNYASPRRQARARPRARARVHRPCHARRISTIMEAEAAANVPKHLHPGDSDPKGATRRVPQEPLAPDLGPGPHLRHRVRRLQDAQPPAHGKRAVHVVPHPALPQSRAAGATRSPSWRSARRSPACSATSPGWPRPPSGRRWCRNPTARARSPACSFRLFWTACGSWTPRRLPREPYVTIQFLWRFLSLAGYQPDTRRLRQVRRARWESARRVLLPPSRTRFCAPPAAARPGHAFPRGALRYLDATPALPLDTAVEVSLEEQALRALRETLPRMVQSVLEGELASLRWVGAGR